MDQAKLKLDICRLLSDDGYMVIPTDFETVWFLPGVSLRAPSEITIIAIKQVRHRLFPGQEHGGWLYTPFILYIELLEPGKTADVQYAQSYLRKNAERVGCVAMVIGSISDFEDWDFYVPGIREAVK